MQSNEQIQAAAGAFWIFQVLFPLLTKNNRKIILTNTFYMRCFFLKKGTIYTNLWITREFQMQEELLQLAPLIKNLKETNLSEHESNEEANGVLTLNDLKSLIYLGRLTKTVKISGFSFEISTLTTSQQRDIMVDIMSDGDAAQRMLDVKPLTMSYAVTSINGFHEELCDEEERRLFRRKESTLYTTYNRLC